MTAQAKKMHTYASKISLSFHVTFCVSEMGEEGMGLAEPPMVMLKGSRRTSK